MDNESGESTCVVLSSLRDRLVQCVETIEAGS